MSTVWEHYIKELLPLIREGLEKGNYELLRGIQSLSCFTIWSPLQTIENIINVLFDQNIHLIDEKTRLTKYIDANKEELERTGQLELYQQKLARVEARKIFLSNLISACTGLSDVEAKLNKLHEEKFIIIEKTPGGSATVQLSPIWNGTIDHIHNQGYEHDIFSSAIGKMIALGIEKKGIKPLKPLILSLKRAFDDGWISHGEFQELYVEQGIPFHRFASVLERDNEKHPDLRMIPSKTEERVYFAKHSTVAVYQWYKRVQKRLRQLGY